MIKKKEVISFSKFLDYLNLNENTYISSLNNKLTKLHILKKQTPINIKTNVYSICVVHLWFANIIFNLSYLLRCIYNILCVMYGKNKYVDNIKIMFYSTKMHHQKNDANVRIQKLVFFFFNVQ